METKVHNVHDVHELFRTCNIILYRLVIIKNLLTLLLVILDILWADNNFYRLTVILPLFPSFNPDIISSV